MILHNTNNLLVVYADLVFPPTHGSSALEKFLGNNQIPKIFFDPASNQNDLNDKCILFGYVNNIMYISIIFHLSGRKVNIFG